MTRTGLGIVGLGGLGEALLRDVARLSSSFHLAAVCDVESGVAADSAQRYGAAWWGDDFEALLRRPEVEAVVLCTPNGLHAGQAQQALQAGKDVLVQKPLALSLDQARATIDLAAARSRVLFVDYTYRFLPTMDAFRSAMVQLGPIRAARAVFHNIYGPGAHKRWFFDARQSGGGALIDLGVHLLDLSLWLLRPTRVDLLRTDFQPADGPAGEQGVESAATLTMRLDAIEVTVDVSWNAPRPQTEIVFELIDDHGRRLRWENVDGSFFRFRVLRDQTVLLDRETTLREDTLREFAAALERRAAPAIDARVYALLDQAYRRTSPTSA